MFFSKKQDDVVYDRPIQAFKGNAVVVGCSHRHRFCETSKLFHASPDEFYTIDINSDHRPDFIFDITIPLPLDFKRRFKLTLVECLDYNAYNHQLIGGFIPGEKGTVGFDNIWEMTAEDGFVLFIGCPRLKEFREQMCFRDLNVIELDKCGENVLICKNQKLNQKEIQEKLDMLPQPLRSSIYQAMLFKANNPFKIKFSVVDRPFCKEPFEQLQTVREHCISDFQKN